MPELGTPANQMPEEPTSDIFSVAAGLDELIGIIAKYGDKLDLLRVGGANQQDQLPSFAEQTDTYQEYVLVRDPELYDHIEAFISYKPPWDDAKDAFLRYVRSCVTIEEEEIERIMRARELSRLVESYLRIYPAWAGFIDSQETTDLSELRQFVLAIYNIRTSGADLDKELERGFDFNTPT